VTVTGTGMFIKVEQTFILFLNFDCKCRRAHRFGSSTTVAKSGGSC